ncbi:MAG TPA: serine protease [Baekduia sp.]|nr:serine protease [Baekduia sp.]
MSRRRVLAGVAAAAALALAPSTASAWAPAATAPVHPGVQVFTDGAQCTANFVFTSGGTTYLGQAAHCSGTGAATDTNGCDSGSLPLGTPVEVTGASKPGKLAYNSWITMQANGEADDETCQYNDLALIELDPADVAKVNPSIPKWGGPAGVGTAAALDDIYSYGNSSLRQGITQLSPKRGKVVEVTPGGWSYSLYTFTPGIPGDSGSAFLNAGGQALGVLSTVAIAPLPLSNGVGDIGKEIAYARAHGFSDLTLVNGTEPFKGGLPIG